MAAESTNPEGSRVVRQADPDARRQQAQAVVVWYGMHRGQPGLHDPRSGFTYRLALEVTFDDGTTEVVERCLGDSVINDCPSKGDRIPVRYDPDDHSRIEIDRPALEQRMVARAASVAKAKQDAIDQAKRTSSPR